MRDTKILLVIMLGFVLLVAAGCATPKYSGFLQDYSILKPGREGGVQLVYIRENTDFTKYKKIMADHVVFFFKESAEYKGIHADELNELADEFHRAFIQAVGEAYPLVNTPAPDVMRIRVAITELEPSNPAACGITTILPAGLAVSMVKKGVTGKYTGVGSISIEAEILDSLTNERLAAAVDTRAGGKLAGFTKWGVAKDAFTFWANRLRAWLDETHAKK